MKKRGKLSFRWSTFYNILTYIFIIALLHVKYFNSTMLKNIGDWKVQIKLTVANNLVSRGWLPTRECVKPGFHIVVSVVRKKIHRTDKNFMESSRTNAQYKRNDRYNLLYEIEWILSVLWIFFVRQTRQIQRYGNQAKSVRRKPNLLVWNRGPPWRLFLTKLYHRPC